MKTQLSSKIMTLLIALVMIALISALMLTAFAADPTEITEIKSTMAKENVPRAGKEVARFMPNVPDGEPYERPWNGSRWHDEQGVMIAPSVNHFYDLGYEFEAGRTYYADYTYWADYGYTFAENPTISLTGPDPSMFTYEIIDRSEEDRSVTVRYTFTIPGERDYPDINKVSMEYYGGYAEGAQKPDWSRLIYNNCTITREEWNTGTWGSECDWEIDDKGYKRFIAGKTYIHMIELTAKDGYKFSENLLVQKGIQSEEEYGEVVLSNDRTVATVTYTHTIAGMEYLDTVKLDPKAGDNDFYLIRGDRNLTSGVPFTTYYIELVQPDLPYEVQNSYEWYDVETNEELRYGVADRELELGKQYRLEFNIDIKDEYYDFFRFDNDTKLLINDYLPGQADYVKIETVTAHGAGQIKVKITYTVQPKPGEGSNASNPVICYNYNEFKYAMENSDIRYVALGNINETIPIGEEGLVTAIHVNGIKNLHLLGDATFTAPANADTTYAALLHTTQSTTLNISGAGSLTFKAVANSSFNAVIYNQGGSINISSGSLIGSYNTAVYGTAIWQEYGELRISDGQFYADNALASIGLPTPMSAVIIHGGQAWIQGGTFRMRNWIDTIDEPYGLQIGKDATVDLSGGTFHGILLPTSSTPLANYMDEDFYTSFTNESKFNPESAYSQQYAASGNIVRIAWLVDHVDVHINSPVAGVDITENYFNIPTSGCQATMYYPQWYKNGESITYGTFEAGASYKVVVQIEVKPGYGAEFTDNVTVAVNNKTVTVKRLSAHWIEIEYDFGECPNIIPLVELTATAPKEGQKPSYTIGLGSNAYKLVGNYNNYKDYRQWYMSSDGDEWWPINDSHTFMAGYYYKVVVDIQTASGYEFPLYDDGSRIMPDVSATVNGYYARVIKAYDQDPATYITVEYNFGECNDSIVEQIAVVDVAAPVAGERPNYTYNILGSGYQMNTAKNAYKDIYWTNPTEKWYYIKNGIGWYDLTDDDWVYEHETFIPGHEYRMYVYLIAEDGYEFAYTTKYYENAVTATVNGNTAEVQIWDGYWASQRRVAYSFTCAQKDVNTILIYDLDDPQAGKTPDSNITVAYPELYTVKNIRWLDEEDGVVNFFEQGRLYTVEIVIQSAQFSGADATLFANDMTAYIDGTKVEGWSNRVIKNDDNTVTIRYSFRKPAQAPEIEVYAFTAQPKGGTLTVGESLTVSWATNIKPEKFETQYWDGTMWILWLEQYVDGNSSSYTFYNPNAQSSRFRVVAYIGEEAVATSNEFVITWEEQEYIYYYYPGEAAGSPDFDFAFAGTDITLADCMFQAPEGKRFKAWAIGSINGEQKQPGEKITINAETYIYAIWEVIPHTCVGVLQSGQPATCTVDGWKDYYQCQCGNCFEDANCTVPITSLSTWKKGNGQIPAEHHYGNLIPKENAVHTATELKGEVAAHYFCNVCNTYFDDHYVETSLEMLTSAPPSHSYTNVNGYIDANGHANVCSCGAKDTIVPHNDRDNNHKCDTCSANVGIHEAATGKHTCDYCGKTVTECADGNKDHKCDTCQAAMGTHEAANGKHTCNYCDQTVTACADSNKNHKCDTCQTAMGTHEAANGKHTCDYCGNTVSECFDSSEDDDSKCDICGKNIGDCVDANKDHQCDKHGEDMGAHEAALGKHTCDYCGATVTACADSNTDHKCDTCETTVGVHEAANGKHTCNYCGKAVTECIDEDKDHQCDTCQAVMGTHETANDTHTCDYCGVAMTQCSDSNADGKCDICSKNLDIAHTHTFVEGKCTCGETDPSYIPPHQHTFIDGMCACGETDPNYTPGIDNPEQPDDERGISAMMAIILSSIAIVCVGGVALFWFVIRKKPSQI